MDSIIGADKPDTRSQRRRFIEEHLHEAYSQMEKMSKARATFRKDQPLNADEFVWHTNIQAQIKILTDALAAETANELTMMLEKAAEAGNG
jgi:hypothetical protein